MADAAPVLMWISGPNRNCTFFNQRWLAFSGRTLEQELGDGWVQGVHPEDLNRCLEAYASSFDTHAEFEMEYRLRRWDGAYRWVLDKGVPLFEGGLFAGYIGSCVDITDIKMGQEGDFAKQRLETVGGLAGGIAHDFNNLLGGILAHSEVALNELKSGISPTEELQRIQAASTRGAEVVRQLMIYAGQESEVLELVDVAAVVEDMLGLLHISISKHVKVKTDFGENLPVVRANPTQIRQVAMNVIMNASEAMGEQDGLIRITAQRASLHADQVAADSRGLAAGEYLQLEISDTGKGMTPQVKARIFDPYFTTKASGSHGHGLVVVHRIVQNLRGAIEVSSTPGEGTRFRIFLRAEDNAGSPIRSTIARSIVDMGVFSAGTVLVVDDEDLLRQAVAKMLRKKGLSVIEASDGSGALEILRTGKTPIDVLLLDVTLPGASSRRVYEEAKSLRPGMAVIVTSAKAEERAASSLATNLQYFLRKPFRLNDLLGMIREMLPSDPASIPLDRK